MPRGGNGELLCASGRQRGGAVRGGNGEVRCGEATGEVRCA